MARYYDSGDNTWYEPDDYPSARELAEDADADIERHADEESFDAYYADEIEGRAEYPVPPPVEKPALRNAFGQLQLSLGAAY